MQSSLIPCEQFSQRGVRVAGNPPTSICARVAAWAAVAPDRLAVADGAARLTFADLESRANRLAAHLLEQGAAPERCVGLFLERSTEFVVAALAVLKTGAAYLPLDPSTPTERAAFMLADAEAPLVLTHRGKSKTLPSGPWRVIEIDGPDAERIAARPTTPLHVDPAPSSLAYVVYTSGSTGRPRGVEIAHANLAHLIDWHQSAFGVTSADRAGQVAGLGFDATGWEVWPNLTAGASLHIADESTRRSPQALRDWLVAEKITISFVPTVLAEQLIHMAWPAETALRTLLCGGDTLRRRPVAGLPFVLVNNYGPTECTIVTTSGAVSADGDGTPSIGRPIGDTAALILDESLRPVPDGEPGELCLAGSLVGRGYRNDPQLTATRFVTYQPASGPPLRIYRTGDRARLLADGEIAFLGRLDDQVKVRGYRIEPGEVVASLDRFPGIDACAVTTRDGPDGPFLVAYVVGTRDVRLTASALREFLGSRLPDYMIPAHFVPITALPLTNNGKLDRSALPAPTADNVLPHRHPEASTTQTAKSNGDGYQEKLAALVASLLGQPSVDPQENFFMLGGHSMLGVQLVARIRDLFGVKLTLRQLFTAPTVAALSAEVARLSQDKK